MLGFQQKITKRAERQKVQPGDAGKTSEPDSAKAGILELSDLVFNYD